jgi:hypothetical protein
LADLPVVFCCWQHDRSSVRHFAKSSLTERSIIKPSMALAFIAHRGEPELVPAGRTNASRAEAALRPRRPGEPPVLPLRRLLLSPGRHGSSLCETIKHLFFQCRFVRFIWSIIQLAFSLYSPISVANIFRKWLYGIDLRFGTLIRVEALAVIWSLWLCVNDKKINDKNCSLLQVIY